MFISNLYREPHGLQDTIQVDVLDRADELFLLRNGIQVDLHDHTFKVVGVARLPDSREISVDKVSTIKQLYSDIVAACKKRIH
jgi:hypothetical protein